MVQKRINILFVVEKIGPYHNARFNYLNTLKGYKINVVETNSFSKSYAWEEKINSNYNVFKLENNFNLIKKPFKNFFQIDNIFLNCKPNVIFLTGWYKKIHYLIIFKSQIKKIPLILFSDSRFKDHKRVFFKEFLKKILLRSFSSAIVAGTESSNYLKKLEFRESDIFKPYDVVDNDYFSKRVLKENIFYSDYILCVARFVKKKNHVNLLNAFEIYKEKGGNLNLLIIGSGPEELKIKKIKNKSKFSSSIFIESWKNIDTLHKYYKKAKATVLASSNDQWGLVINESMASGTPVIVSKNCGCYLDLIDEGKTGWGFDPNNLEALAYIFLKVENIKKSELKIMKNFIKLKINSYDLKDFSLAVKDSISNTLANKRFSLIATFFSLFLFFFKKNK